MANQSQPSLDSPTPIGNIAQTSPANEQNFQTLETPEEEMDAARQLNRSKSMKQRAGRATELAGKGTEMAGKGVETTGKAVKTGGKAVKTAGKGTKMLGKGMKSAGRGMQAAGKGMTSAGGALTETVIGSIIGIPLIIAGGATTAAGAGTQAAGTGVEAAGKGIEAVGKGAEAAGKGVEKGGKMMKTAGKEMKDVGQRLKQAPQVGDRKITKKLQEAKKAGGKVGKGDIGGAKEVAKESIGKQITASILRMAWGATIGLSFTLIGAILAIISLAYINIHFLMKYFWGSNAFCEMGSEWTPGGRMPGGQMPAGEKVQKEAGRGAKWAEIIALLGIDVFVLFIYLILLFISTFPIFMVTAILK
jgi:hypothetical protein